MPYISFKFLDVIYISLKQSIFLILRKWKVNPHFLVIYAQMNPNNFATENNKEILETI